MGRVDDVGCWLLVVVLSVVVLSEGTDIVSYGVKRDYVTIFIPL